ncbi:hypothetical protein CYMTET_39977 [Cymbomonas tetramitiformis]|uniref:Uncharacterized protein n=1 Tax=Cymbomonas tetramitiformis TaxID=36881 RepID=A0AAE0F3Q3_9CHLO|nr:hypothetical protein CYMTET_39977 [Cymbomonas tetramitiformis]
MNKKRKEASREGFATSSRLTFILPLKLEPRRRQTEVPQDRGLYPGASMMQPNRCSAALLNSGIPKD